MKDRNPIYDRAKGLGIIFVILGHLFTYGSPAFTFIFSFHMPLFFIISGMLFKEGYRRLVAGYIVPYLFFSCIIGPCLYLISRICINGIFITVGNLITDGESVLLDTFWYISSDVTFMGALWFVGILFASMVIINVVNGFRKKINFKYFDLYFIGLLFIIGSLAQYFHHSIPFRMKTLPMATMFVYIGVVYRDMIMKAIKKMSFGYFPIIMIIFIMGAYFNGTVNIAVPVYNNPIIYLITSLLGSLIVLYVSQYNCLKFVEFYGKNSFIIFAMHGFWLKLYSRVLTIAMGGGEEYHVMQNIPFHLCLIGGILIALLSIPSVYTVTPLLNSFKKIINF